MKCPVCGSENKKIITRDEIGSFYRCLDCNEDWQSVEQHLKECVFVLNKKLLLVKQSLVAIDAYITMKPEMDEEDFKLILRDVRSALGNLNK